MAWQYPRRGWLCALMLVVEATGALAASPKDAIVFESKGGQLNLIITAVEVLRSAVKTPCNASSRAFKIAPIV